MTVKKFLIFSFTLAALYVGLSTLGIAGLSSDSGGILYRFIIFAALLLSFIRSLSFAIKLGDRDALFTCSLGLGMMVVNEVYSFTYIYLLHGDASDITVSNYSRPCAFLFFLSAILLLVLPSLKWERVFRTVVSVVPTVAVVMIFYAVITANPKLLYYSGITVVALCVICAVFLLLQSFKIRQLKNAKIFACSMLMISALDILNRLTIIYDPGWRWRDIIVSIYPFVYLLIGFGLSDLRKPLGQRSSENG